MTKIDMDNIVFLTKTDFFKEVYSLAFDLYDYDKGSKKYKEALEKIESFMVNKTEDEKTIVLMALFYGLGYVEAEDRYY